MSFCCIGKLFNSLVLGKYVFFFFKLSFGHFGEKSGKQNGEEELKEYYCKEIGNLTIVINSFRILQLKGNLYAQLRCVLCSKKYIIKFHA